MSRCFFQAEVGTDRSTFESADLVVDEIAAKLDEFLESDEFGAVRQLLARLSETVAPRYSVTSNLSVEVFEAEPSAVNGSIPASWFGAELCSTKLESGVTSDRTQVQARCSPHPRNQTISDSLCWQDQG